MTALRMTRPDTDRGRPARGWGRWTGSPRALAAIGCVALAGLTGCGSGHDGAASGAGGQPRPLEQIAAGPPLPAPDPERIEYNADSRTLTFYELPESGRWMVKRPGDPYPVQAGPEHKLPVGADPDRTYVYYTRPGGQQSQILTLRAIQDGRTMYVNHQGPGPGQGGR